jgi:release factor glutamine methyltransferase
MTPWLLVREGEERLREGGAIAPRAEAEWLLGKLLRKDRFALYSDEPEITDTTAAQFRKWIDERMAGEPLQYLLEDAVFMGRSFAVGPGVFIPRPETETVVEAALARLRPLARRRGRPLRLIDAGTGSGCIAVTLACELEAWVVLALDVSYTPLDTARGNADRHAISSRVNFVQSDWLEPVAGEWDAIISNPPYIPWAQLHSLPTDVRREPGLALDGGPDGMRDLLQLARSASQKLLPGGLMVLECGEDQVKPLMRFSSGLDWVAFADAIMDLAGRPRGVAWTRRA